MMTVIRRMAWVCLLFLLICLVWLVSGRPAVAQGVEHGGPQAAPMPEMQATPTIDRLAAPPTVPSPTQADEGAQLYWLHCQPCHGDRGQGLTDEWRAQYPPEDQNCWESGCHGERPYDEDFKLPTAVPAVIGEGTLSKFQTLGGVYEYVRVSMPYFYPGDLTEQEYLAILAHIARNNGYWNGTPLTAENVHAVRLQPEVAGVVENSESSAVATPAAPVAGATGSDVRALWGAAGLIVLLSVAGGAIWLRHNHNR